jgi:hypothetical protein
MLRVSLLQRQPLWLAKMAGALQQQLRLRQQAASTVLAAGCLTLQQAPLLVLVLVLTNATMLAPLLVMQFGQATARQLPTSPSTAARLMVMVMAFSQRQVVTVLASLCCSGLVGVAAWLTWAC